MAVRSLWPSPTSPAAQNALANTPDELPVVTTWHRALAGAIQELDGDDRHENVDGAVDHLATPEITPVS